MINWKVRIKNKLFWLAVIPAVLILAQSICAVFGYSLDVGNLGNKLVDVVNSIFALLAIFGIVVDPTTIGPQDSLRAMMYEAPNDDRRDI